MLCKSGEVNMKINRKKVITKVLYYLALSSMTMGACSTRDTNNEEIVEVVIDPSIDEIIADVIEEVIHEEQIPKTDEIKTELEEKTKIEPIYDEDSIEANSKIITTVRSTEDVWIRKDKNIESDKLGKLVEGREFPLIDESDPEWYQIEYYGDIGYVSKECSTLGNKRVMTIPIIDKGYLTNSDIRLSRTSVSISSILPASTSSVNLELIGIFAVRPIPYADAISSTLLLPKISCFFPQSGHSK